MKAVLQRVAQAHVVIARETVGQIERGLLVLVCAERGDSEVQADRLLAKILKLRIFADDAGKMNRSVQDVAGGLLIVSQFTLAADVSGGNRPSFTAAAPPELGRKLYDFFVTQAKTAHPVVQTGIFAADMLVDLVGKGACGGLLIVSQFTLAADVSSGNRPSFTGAALPDEGRRLYDYFVAQARAAHPQVATGQFAADMQVHLLNDGPVTIALRMEPDV